MRSLLGLMVGLALAGPTFASGFQLSHPIDCPLGEDQRCFVQIYPDRDPGPGAQDYACRDLSYDGHKGTDFALRSLAEIDRGVDVIAAAPGRVKGTRDGMADKLYRAEDAAALQGRDCGNGVVIDHGGGWETQYCHLRRGSVTVKTGDRVATGDRLGLVGLSGRTNFPHVHMSLRKNGQQVDPFAPTQANTCTLSDDTLWSDPPPYQPGGLINVGFFSSLPEYDAVKAGTAHRPNLPTDSPALVLWGFAFGSQPGDILRLTITGPDGDAVFAQDVTLDKAQPQLFRAGGRKTNGNAWFRKGTFTGTVEMRRAGQVISDMTTTVTVAD